LDAASKIFLKTRMKSKNKTTEILQSDYQKILAEIQKLIAQTQSNIVKNVTRQKVEMAWKIGKEISENIPKNNQEVYGKNLMERLESDIGIGAAALYKMRNFYKTYPKLPKDDAALNWSHYRILSGIKKADERKYLENLVQKNGWSEVELQAEVKKSKTALELENKDSKPATKMPQAVQKIVPTRGKLFAYQIVKIVGAPDFFFDCGFKIFEKVTSVLPREVKKINQIVAVEKKSEKYLVKKESAPPRKLYAYKAYLERVVDGDTIRVNLDLGFGIFHHEILRLAKISAAELKTSEGEKSAKVLAEILKDVPFLVVKTLKTDIYGRYVADVFLGEVGLEAQEIADRGVYLNQILLERGVVEIFKN
jgi:endonuclease YncB( thermonuclease family)